MLGNFFAADIKTAIITKDSPRQKLFKRLQNHILRKVEKDTIKRHKNNPRPNKIEQCLGVFIEMLEPQVRNAVLELNRKGYSTDTSGFMNNNPCDQKIEGDFRLNEDVVQKLNSIGVGVETNPSGYTIIQFSPKEADINKIKKQWDKIVSMIPNKNQITSLSMTHSARDFRTEYH